MSDKDKVEIYDDFYDAVNMTPSEIEDWLETEKSKSVGQDSGDGESKGRKSAKKIIDIKRTKKDELTDDQLDHMNKVVGYVNRHRAQKPDSDIKESDWRYSLKNWGHDPCKDLDC
jgi:predicted transglutaminase-like cysteine proteinase